MSSHGFDDRAVRSVQFGLLGPEDVLSMSVAEIQSTDAFAANEPVIGGLYDPRMGVLDHNRICKTCGRSNRECPGHYGHIVLARPVFHMQFIDVARKLLGAVCIDCSAALPNPKVLAVSAATSMPRGRRLDFCSKAVPKACTCASCGAQQPDKITRDYAAGTVTLEYGSRDVEKTLDAADVLGILSKIEDADADALGFDPQFARPEWMIATNLLVPPPCIRPSVRNDSGHRSEDDLTSKLSEIVKANAALARKLASSSSSTAEIAAATQALQYHVITFVDNALPGVAPARHRTGRLFRVLRDRLRGKDGRIRGNLLGKRVNSSARTVITPDAVISLAEVGCPLRIARNLTRPEAVTAANYERMKTLVSNGPDTYPGARFVRKGGPTGRVICLKRAKDAARYLEIGDVVERHTVDGDVVLFNRQPSLHRVSMMAHRVRVLPGETFRINLAVSACYNADCDGDEMNFFSPQTLQAAIELEMLAEVPRHVVCVRDAKPIVSIVQDVTLGMFRATRPGTTVPARQAANMLARCGALGAWRETWNDGDGVNTTDLLPVALLPRDGVQTWAPAAGLFGDGTISGSKRWERGAFQSRSTGLVHTVVSDHGPAAATRLLDNAQRFACDFLEGAGASVGISDLVLDRDTLAAVKAAVAHEQQRASALVCALHDGTGAVDAGQFERQINSMLGAARDRGRKAALPLGEEDELLNVYIGADQPNRMLDMILAKSKGNMLNISQMVAALGQQNTGGERIPCGYGGTRALPHFQKGDDGPAARGFVAHSFMAGLAPQEYYFHAVCGREGVVSTSIKTAAVGYIQRRLVKLLEDVVVAHDLCVRGAGGLLIQGLYGEDALHICGLETLPAAPVEDQWLVTGAMQEALKVTLTPGAFAKSTTVQATQAMADLHAQLVQDAQDIALLPQPLQTPVAFTRLLQIARAQCCAEGDMKSDLDVVTVIQRVSALIDDLGLGRTVGGRTAPALVRTYLGPRSILATDGKALTPEAFHWLLDQVRQRYERALAPPGEAVGVITAQSLAAPLMQMSLDSFHSAGISSMSTVTGVPRFQELLSVTKNPKAPCLSVYSATKGEEAAHQLAAALKCIPLGQLATGSSVRLYSSWEALPSFIARRAALGLDEDDERPSPVPPILAAVVVEFADPVKLALHDMSMANLELAVRREVGDRAWVAAACDASPDRDRVLVAIPRCALAVVDADEEGAVDDAVCEAKALEAALMTDVAVSGVRGINEVCAVAPLGSSGGEWKVAAGEGYGASGSLLAAVLARSDVDGTRTRSNHVVEVLEVFGIEAARAVLVQEIQDVLAESSVDVRHVLLLADLMTSRGTLTPVDRHGQARAGAGPLAMAAFEQASERLLQAGVTAEADSATCASASAMLGGVTSAIGTGSVELVVDLDALPAEQVAGMAVVESVVTAVDEAVVDQALAFAFTLEAWPVVPGGMLPPLMTVPVVVVVG
jgi:DNA-directed RNA polymerase II subunit RPB1